MIYLYSGTPGSGKSLHCARTIMLQLKRGLPVIANFDINTKKIGSKDYPFYFWSNEEVTPDRLVSFACDYWKGRTVCEGKLTLVIDECQIMFNSREWNAKGRSDWLSFFTQHRKYGYDVILIAQFDRMIDRQIRSLIEYSTVHRKVSNIGIKGKILSILSLGTLFISVKVWYPMNERIGAEFFTARKKYYSLYDTYNTFGISAEDGDTGSQSDADVTNVLTVS